MSGKNIFAEEFKGVDPEYLRILPQEFRLTSEHRKAMPFFWFSWIKSLPPERRKVLESDETQFFIYLLCLLSDDYSETYSEVVVYFDYLKDYDKDTRKNYLVDEDLPGIPNIG
ncbi:unnamed protein product [Periconia digitata]|uniref:Uncharacterized protein n=1 Tax=Periconia digitata TaxID=1303443 RepID=A0A9W4URM6_9PLEO|nr:unnamed protein product [Periconia digitata]